MSGRVSGRKKRWRLSLVLLIAGQIGCAEPQRFIPDDVPISASEEVRIVAGRGITFKTLDGAPVAAREIVVLPGEQSLRLDVRRSLKSLSDASLSDIYSVGSCRIRFESVAGSHYEVVARPFSTHDLKITEETGADGEERNLVGVTIHVVDEMRGSEYVAPPDACDLRLDCTKLNRSLSRPGSECDR